MNFKPFEIRMATSQPGPNDSGPGSQTGPTNGVAGPPSSSCATGAGVPLARAKVYTTGIETEQFGPSIHRWIEELEEAIVVLDSGIIVESNSRAPSLFGRPARSILGWHLKQLVTGESLMRLSHFLEFDDPEPALLLAVRHDRRTFPLQLKAIASIIGNGCRLRVTSLTRCGAVEKAHDETTPPDA